MAYYPFTGSNGAAWGAPWTVVNGTIQGNRGRLAPGAADYTTARAHTTGIDIADVRLTGTFRINTLSEQYPAIGVRHNGSWNGGLVNAGLILYLDIGANSFILQTVAGGVDLESSSSASVTWVVNTDYRFTIEVIEGSGVTHGRAKVWRPTVEQEPEDWMIDESFDHASRPVSGGISAVNVSGFSDATSYIEIDDLIVQDYDDDRIRVLAVGDSITAGAYNHPDYPALATWRKYFFDDHEGGANPLQMVGQNWACGVSEAVTFTPGTYAGLGTWDHDHHARNSWTTDNVLANVGADATNYLPDVAIVYIGLNDLLNGASAATTAGKVGDIIDAIRAAKADVKFVLCQIAPVAEGELVDFPIGTVDAFNSALATLASTETTGTSPIELADCNTGFDEDWLYVPADEDDGRIHPDDEGDHFIADAITVAFDAVLLYEPPAPGAASYTELEWSIGLQAPAADIYEFRVYAGSTPLDTYAVTPQLTVGVGGGVNYSETGRQITITAAVTPADQVDFKELGLQVAVVATPTVPTDKAGRKELTLPLSVVAATTAPTEQVDFKELALAISVVATTTVTPQYDHRELVLSIPVTAATTITDRRGNKELALAVPVVATATLAVEQADFKELALTTPVTATTTITDRRNNKELALAIPVVATTAATAQADFKETAIGTGLPVPVVLIITVEDHLIGGPINYNETGRTVTIVAAITSTDQADFKEVVTVSQAVRFNSSDAILVRPSAGALTFYTMAGWVYLSADTNNYVTFFGFDSTSGDHLLVGTSSDGQSATVWRSGAGTGVFATLNVGVWYWLAVSSNPEGTIYWAAAGDTALSVSTGEDIYTLIGSTWHLVLGNDSFGDTFNGRLSQVKVWSDALTQTELEAEWKASSPVRTANLYAYYSFRNGPQTSDESGNGRTLTVGGTLSSEAGLFVNGPQIFITAGVTATDALTVGGVSYNETNRPIGITATTAVIEQVDYKSNVGLAVPIVGTTTATDKRKNLEPALSVPVVATTTTPTNQADFKTTPALDLPIVASVACTDNQQSPGHYEDTDLPILITASTTTVTEQTDYKDLARSVPIVASTAVTEVRHYYNPGLSVAITAAVALTHQADFKELVKALNVSSTVSLTAQADYHQTLAVLIVATVMATDLQHYANGVILNTALALYLGGTPVSKVYAGATQVWP